MQAEIQEDMPDRINLKKIHSVKETYQYSLDSSFFSESDHPLLNGGMIDAEVGVWRDDTDGSYKVNLKMNGHVVVACDRCLSDLQVPVKVDEMLKVVLGDEDDDKGDLIVVSEREPLLDLNTLFYDYAALSVPIHAAHAEGECDAEMESRLSEYLISKD